VKQKNNQFAVSNFPENRDLKGHNAENLSPEQIIEWLDGHRQFMFEVWEKNPELRKEWELLNK